jgi:hypothetical protein
MIRHPRLSATWEHEYQNTEWQHMLNYSLIPRTRGKQELTRPQEKELHKTHTHTQSTYNVIDCINIQIMLYQHVILVAVTYETLI